MLRDARRYDEAIGSYERALQIDPKHAAVQNNLGIVLREVGRFDAGAACHRRALEIDPRYAKALSALSGAREYKRGDPLVERMEDLLADDRHPRTIAFDSTLRSVGRTTIGASTNAHFGSFTRPIG